MAKFALAVIMAVLVCQGYSNPLVQDGDVAKAAAAGDWDGVHKILKQFVQNSGISAPQAQAVPQFGSVQLPSFSGDVSNPGSGGRYFTQSEYIYQQKQTGQDGKVSEDKGGLGMINDNGKVTYYKPQNAALVAPYGK